MTITYYHYCDSNEISTGTSTILGELDKKDWSADQILSHIIAEIKAENNDLTNSIKHTLGNVLVENVRIENEVADNDFVCCKQFVKANTYLPDANKAKNALDVWELFKSHNLNFHKQSYEKQLTSSKSLLSNLESEKFQVKVDSLVGVVARIEKFKESTFALDVAYSKMMEANASKEDVVAPSSLKNVVRKIVNERLLPHLENAAKAMPESYQETLNVISETIAAVNLKSHTRKTIRSKAETEEIPVD